MDRPVLERARELAELAAAAREAAAGRGSVVLVSGEAGIGKSRLVEASRAHMPAEGRVLVGHCDDMATARILGPFRDMIGGVGVELGEALRTGADRDHILAALKSELSWNGNPTLLAIEDVHWADDATLDVLQYLVRRIADLPAVLLLTYRDDDLPGDHPARRLLGLAAAGPATHHLPLHRLSPESVRQLCAGTTVDPDELFAVTAGNPFFVSEVLAAGGAHEVPRTVVDAVLARSRLLDPAARAAVEQLAVLPTTIERWLVDALVEGGLATLTAAEERGVLTVTPTRLSFRHELTRRAIVDTLPVVRRTALNARVLAALLAHDDTDVARIVHHAAEVGDRDAIVRYGPVAARDAAGGGAHREAAAHYRLVLEHEAAFPPAELAGLLEGYAAECLTIGAHEQAAQVQQRAIALRRTLGDALAEGIARCGLSRMQRLSNLQHAELSAQDAVELLEGIEGIDTSVALSNAYSNLAELDILAFRTKEAMPRLERAVALARSGGDASTLAHALGNLASCRWDLGFPDGQQLMEESLQVALAAGEADTACRAYVNLVCSLIDRYQLGEAERYALAGVTLATATEHLGALTAFRVLRARIALGRGRWDSALTGATAIAEAEPGHRCPALMVMGRVRARRGDAGSTELLATAVQLGHQLGDLQRTGWATMAAAEDAWLRGDHAAVGELAGPIFRDTRRRDASTLWPELGYWLLRSGHAAEMDASESPFSLLAAGRWREAADVWRLGGHRYEYAMALAESGDTDTLLVALEELDGLGARPLAAITRQRLRDLGVTQIPRGPAGTTRANPAGLTARQLEVLRLLAEGMTNAEIAARLVISVRTAGNHVGAVLDKLGVHTRADAARHARDLLG